MQQTSSRLHKIKRGLDLPIKCTVEQRIEDAPPVHKVAVLADDYVGMRPRMRVQEGDRVKRGQKLFEDRKREGVFHTAPGAGTVVAIHRGDRRALRSVVIELDESELGGGTPAEVEYESLAGVELNALTSEQVRAALIESGLWTTLRARPFSRTPDVGSAPKAIFVNAMDSNPLAADPDVVLAGKEEELKAGLAALVTLGGGAPVYLCKAAGARVSAGDVAGVETHEFTGPHPAGTAGLHMHMIAPVNREHPGWYLDYQAAVAIGHFLSTGKQTYERVVSLAGPPLATSRLVRTRVGAAIDPIVAATPADGDVRVFSGSVFNGRDAEGDVEGYLGRFHNQITVLHAGGRRRFMGWVMPGAKLFSVLRVYLGALIPGKKFAFDTDTHGGHRAFVPVGTHDKVMPFLMMPSFLLRSILSADVERAEELGALELDEEDLALCTFVCPSKIDYGQALRTMLTLIEKEG